MATALLKECRFQQPYADVGTHKPASLVRWAALLALLTPLEQRAIRNVVGAASAEELREWIDTFATVALPDALRRMRAIAAAAF